MRVWLDFRFAGLPARIGTAVTIFLNNMKLVALAGVAAVAVQARASGRLPHGLTISPNALKWLSRASKIALGMSAIINITIVGIAVGAYGTRMCIAMLPHGPVELSAYCVSIRFYLVAGRRPLLRRDWLLAGGLAVGLLALAALLETFAWLR
jgi:hypothetical protein